MSSCTVSFSISFFIFLNQSVFSLRVTVRSLMSLQKCLFCSATGITLSFCVPSNSLNNLFGLIQISNSANTALSYCHIFLVLLQRQLTFVQFLRQPLQNLSVLQRIFIQALIWRLHFKIPFISFCLIVLTHCEIPCAFLKFFFANFVASFLSSPFFCNPPSQ